jgi:hypothetical protein
MEFIPINEDSKIYPGEYLLHSPSRQIVICGAYKKSEKIIKVLGNGSIFEDRIGNFKKLRMNKEEMKRRRCSSCK